MRITEAGKVTEGIWFLGSEESGLYLVEGSSSSMLVSSGMSWLADDVLEQMKRFNLDEERIEKILILHAHFDHIGLVPLFTRRLPEAKVYGAAAAWKAIGDPRIMERVNHYNRKMAKRYGRPNIFESYDLEWRDDIKGFTVSEGDRLDCGDLGIEIIEIPGHSPCSIAAYEPSTKTLFPSDGGGIPFKDTIIPSGTFNYTLFQESLEKLGLLEVDHFCADHGGYIKGEDARQFVRKAMDAARDFRKLMERVYRRSGSVEAAVGRLVSIALAARPDYFLNRDILEGIYLQMIRHVASRMGEAG